MAVGFIRYLTWASRGKGNERIIWFGTRRGMAWWPGPWNKHGDFQGCSIVTRLWVLLEPERLLRFSVPALNPHGTLCDWEG